ncbi:MAG: hypothetical protein ACK4UN_06950, partial [Limisphaerales bacterium]
KVDETYFRNRRMVSRRSYEKARVAYPDMPPADDSLEDTGAELLRAVRQQQRRNKAESERRLSESEESRFPRPESTNWLRVIAGDKSHLVVFASRDWKVLTREIALPSGREWLNQFGFNGPANSEGESVIAKGLEIGYEVEGDREAMLEISKALLPEVEAYDANPPDTSTWGGSIRPRKKKKPVRCSWPKVLPPLIDFLASLSEPKLKIFNHHQQS